MHSLAKRVLEQIERLELMRPGDRVGVAVSGGIDSVALLRLLLELRQELGIVLSVVHFNHKLRGTEAEADQAFVQALAREHGLEFYVSSGDAGELAALEQTGVEAAARELRYGFFYRLLGGTSAAKAAESGGSDRSAGSAALPKGEPRGLKPESEESLLRGAKAPLFHGGDDVNDVPLFHGTAKAASLHEADGAAESRALSNHFEWQHPGLDKIATGHTLDDQAETVLMRLIRGTGLRGLGGIYPRIVVEHENDEGHGEIVRPLLGMRRRELESYLAELKQPWREDATNAEFAFTRNRVRKMLMPVLEREFNPAVVENLSELAEIARDEEDYWEGELSGWLGTVVQWIEPEWARGAGGSAPLVQIQPLGSNPVIEDEDAIANASVSRPWLLTEPKAVQRRVVKAIGEQVGIPLEFKHVEEILRFAAEEGPAGKELSLPLGWKVVREPEQVLFVAPEVRASRLLDYQYSLPVPGRVFVPELGETIEALRITYDSANAEYNAQRLLRADLLQSELTVRNWRPGDRFWPAHTKEPKKIKELLQERHVREAERKLWPVVLSGDEIVWMRGFAVPAKLAAAAGKEAVMIRDVEGEPGI